MTTPHEDTPADYTHDALLRTVGAVLRGALGLSRAEAAEHLTALGLPAERAMVGVFHDPKAPLTGYVVIVWVRSVEGPPLKLLILDAGLLGYTRERAMELAGDDPGGEVFVPPTWLPGE